MFTLLIENNEASGAAASPTSLLPGLSLCHFVYLRVFASDSAATLATVATTTQLHRRWRFTSSKSKFVNTSPHINKVSKYLSLIDWVIAQSHSLFFRRFNRENISVLKVQSNCAAATKKCVIEASRCLWITIWMRLGECDSIKCI